MDIRTLDNNTYVRAPVQAYDGKYHVIELVTEGADGPVTAYIDGERF